MSDSNQEENIDPIVAAQQAARKKALRSFSAAFISAVGSAKGSDQFCPLSDAMREFDIYDENGIISHMRKLDCKNIPELVQLLENKVELTMDVEKRYWVKILQTDNNRDNFKLIDKGIRSRSRTRSRNRRGRGGREGTSSSTASDPNLIPLREREEQMLRDFEQRPSRFSMPYNGRNPYNYYNSYHYNNRYVQHPLHHTPANHTPRGGFGGGRFPAYQRPGGAFSSSAAQHGSNSSSSSSIFNLSMPAQRPPLQPLFPNIQEQPLFPNTPETVMKLKQQSSMSSQNTNNDTSTQTENVSDNTAKQEPANEEVNTKQHQPVEEVTAAEVLGVFSNSSLSPVNPEANNGGAVNVPAVPRAKLFTPTARLFNRSIEKIREEAKANNGNGLKSPATNGLRNNAEQKKAKPAEHSRTNGGNHLSDLLGDMQISTNDTTSASTPSTSAAAAIPLDHTIGMDDTIKDALEAPLMNDVDDEVDW